MNYRQNIHLAAETLLDGGVIAYPTEGVFGLGCDPFNADAVGRILDIKQRPVDKGLILIADDLARFAPYLSPLTAEQRSQLVVSWPGPYTWVVPHNGSLPDWITGGRDTVAIRVSGHPLARALSAQAGMPIVSTSANRSGRPSLITSLQVRSVLGGDIDCLLHGRVQTPGQASQIRDLISGRQFRG